MMKKVPFKTTEYDRAFGEVLQEIVYGLARAQSPLLQQIRVEPTFGPAGTVVDSRRGDLLELPERAVGFTMGFRPDDVRNGRYEALVVTLDEASEELGKGLVGMLMETVGTVTENTGNIVSGELSFETVYAALEQLEWSLTDDDELSMPQIVMHPDAFKKFPSEPTPEQQAAIEELKRRKHEELLARRRRRRLS